MLSTPASSKMNRYYKNDFLGELLSVSNTRCEKQTRLCLLRNTVFSGSVISRRNPSRAMTQ